MNKLKTVGIVDPIGLTSVNGINLSGKSTLVQGLGIAALYIEGFVFTDMSAIFKWHRDPANKSPFMEAAIIAKQLQEDTGKLAPDGLTIDCFVFFISWVKKTNGKIRHICISGLPRTAYQLLEVMGMFPKMRMAYIYCAPEVLEENRLNRIKRGEGRIDDSPETFKDRCSLFYDTTFAEVIGPFEKAYKNSKRFIQINYSANLESKLLALTYFMDIKLEERCSLRGQIQGKDTLVKKFIEHIEKPPKATHAESIAKPDWPKAIISPWLPSPALIAQVQATV